MNEKKLFNKLNDELEQLVPSKRKMEDKKPMAKAKSSANKKYILAAVATCLVVAIVLTCVLVIGKDKGPDTIPASSTFVAMDINPSIEMIVDENNKVVSVYAANEDAELLLYVADSDDQIKAELKKDKDGNVILNADLAVATENIISLAVEYGYLREDNKDVNVTIEGTAGVTVDTTVGEIIDSAIAAGAGTLEVVSTHVTSAVLAHELKVLKDANPDNADYQALTAGKLRLIKSARLHDRTLTMDAAVAMSMEDLTAKVEEAHNYYKDKIGTTVDFVLLAAEKAYETAKAFTLDSAYLSVVSDNYGVISLNTLNAGKYVAYTTLVKGLNAAADLSAAYKANPIVTEDDLRNLITAVGVEDVDAKMDAFKADVAAYGELTAANIEKYINDLSLELAELEQGTAEYIAKEAEINFALSVNDGLDEKCATVAFSFSADGVIDTLLSTVQKGLSLAQGLLADVDIPANAEEWKDMSTETFNKLIADLTALADESYKAMNLTDEDKADIEAKQAADANKIKQFEDTLNSAIEAANARATERLTALKNTRIQFTANLNVSGGASELY